jgi:hypothetical protein
MRSKGGRVTCLSVSFARRHVCHLQPAIVSSLPVLVRVRPVSLEPLSSPRAFPPPSLVRLPRIVSSVLAVAVANPLFIND